ncbi:hypothetical protein J7J62_04370 [bacterium]|nr:hypothetical protein [bacterium]
MKMIRWNDVPIAENPHGVDARKLYDTKNAALSDDKSSAPDQTHQAALML